MHQKKSIKVFLASSSELLKDRNDFALMIERKNKLWALTDRPYIDLQMWEICSESVTATRTQDEYNSIIKTVDILIVLVWTKVGMYTSEEFQLAKQLFIRKGKPTVIVYQKESNHIEESLTQYLSQFTETGKEYFHGKYDTFSELEAKFLNQFDIHLNKFRITKLTEKDKNRIELLEGLERRYAKRILSKMDSELNFQLELILEYTKAGTTDEYITDYFVRDYDSKTWEGFNELFYDFETNLKRLLILGEPGAGKTVLLLQFAKRLIEKAKINFDYPLPFILNLATWRNEYQDFKTWLEDNLVYAAGEYGTAKKYAKELVVENNMLLLLDGLDEIPEADRESCLEKLWDYIKQNENTKANIADYPQILICSRKNEYEQLTQNAPVKASLYIAPLKANEIIKTLEQWQKDNSSAKVLLNRIKTYPFIATELSTSFDVHLALHLANEYDFKNFSKEKLLETFILTELNKIEGTKSEKSKHYLSFLASVLSKTKKVITFELIDIQPRWINLTPANNEVFEIKYDSYRKKNYKLPKSFNIILIVLRSVFIFIISLLFELIMNLTTSYSSRSYSKLYNLISEILISLFLGIVFSVVNTSKTNIILIVESKTISVKGFRFSTFSSTFVKQFERIFKSAIPFCLLILLVVTFFKVKDEYFDISFEGIKESFSQGFLGIISQFFKLSLFPTEEYKAFFLKFIIFISIIKTFLNRKNILNKKKDGIDTTIKIITIAYYFIKDFFYKLTKLWFIQSVVLGLGYGLYYNGPYILFFRPFIENLMGLIFIVVIICFFSGIFNGFIESLFMIKRSPNIDKPYRRIISSILFDFMKLSIPLTIGVLILSSIIYSNFEFVYLISIILRTQCFVLIINFHHSAFFKHLAVRVILSFQKKTPLLYRTFLNKVSKTGLMEKDGGQWRFRHQLIQDWFARQYTQQ